MTIKFAEEKESFLLDISSMLYDFELAHDFAVLVENQETYRDYKFNRFFWYRNGRPIKKEHRIRALKIVKQSPLIIEVLIPTIGAVWGVLKIIEQVSTWNLKNEKLRLEVEKLRDEKIERRQKAIEEFSEQEWSTFEHIEPNTIEKKIVHRLSGSKLKACEIEVADLNEKKKQQCNQPDGK